jgi:hypothetical protein
MEPDMKYLRYLLILMGLWIFLVGMFGGWLGAPLVTPYAYLIIALCAVLPILFPLVDRSSPFVLFSIAVLLLIALRAWSGYAIDQAGLQTLALEVIAIGVTILLATLLGAQISTVQALFKNLGLGKLEQHVDSFDEGQHAIYREVRWARRYQRPLAMLAITLNDASLQHLMESQAKPTLAHRLAKEAQSEIWRSYALTQLAQLLVAELGDNAIVTQRREHFVVVLTAVDRAQTAPIVEKIKTLCAVRLEVKLDIGVAVFPDEAVTFEALLDQAEMAMAASALPEGVSSDTLPLPTPHAVAAHNVAAHTVAAEAPKSGQAVSNRQDIRANDEVTSSA